MNKLFNGLSVVNVELTSRCDKNCWMCGRRKMDREYPKKAMKYGDMDFELVQSISRQLPEGIVVQLHNNGESLLYPRFGDAARLFNRQIRCLDTNGKLVVEKADEIIGNIDTITFSIIENDDEADAQYGLIKEFFKIKGNEKPFVIIRVLGDVDLDRYEGLGALVVRRVLHSPEGSFNYKKKPTIPEIGICLDMLNHLCISRDGRVSICVRFDPEGRGIIGDANKTPLVDIWNSPKRKQWLKYHIDGKRGEVPLCSNCEFWGVPTGY